MTPRARVLGGTGLQLAIVLVTLFVWSIALDPTTANLLFSYVGTWAVLNAIRAWAPNLLRSSLSRWQMGLLALVLLIAPIARASRWVESFVEGENLDYLDHLTAARLRLERAPSIHPPLVSGDLPQTFYVNAPEAERVSVDFSTGTRLHAAPLGRGLFRVLYNPRIHGAVEPTDRASAGIFVDGVRTARSMMFVRAEPHPRWLARSPSGETLATVSEETDSLAVLTREGLVATGTTLDGPSDVVFLDETHIAVCHRYSSAIGIYLAQSGGQLDLIEVGFGASHMAIRSDRAELAITLEHGELALIRLDDRQNVARVQVEFEPEWIAYGPDDDRLIVSSRRPAALHRFHRTERGFAADASPLPLGRPAVTLAMTHDRARAIVPVTHYQPDERTNLGNHYIEDQLLTVAVERWQVVGQRTTATRTQRQRGPGEVDRGVSPMGVFSDERGAAWIAFAGTDDIWRISPGEAVPTIFTLDDVPLATPLAVMPFESGGFAVTSAVYASIGIFDEHGELERLIRLGRSDEDLLREDQPLLQRRIGERTFFESTRSGVSCQSCHLHTGSDGALHNIGGNTLVATLDPRGILGTPPYLRDGGYPFLGSLHELSRTLYRGFLREQGGRVVGLDRYLQSLPRRPPSRQLGRSRQQDAEARGLELFVEARCPMCHAFPAFTNLGQHPPRAIFTDFAASHTSEQLDTPSLLGLERSAPYLVDGRAETLRAIFRDHDATGRHGDTSGLSDDELDDLLYFVEGL